MANVDHDAPELGVADRRVADGSSTADGSTATAAEQTADRVSSTAADSERASDDDSCCGCLPPDATLRHTILGMLPLVSSGLGLLGCFPKTLATKLLPSITPLLASLQDVCKAPANRGKESPAASFSDDFNLSAPTSFESSHPYSLSSLSTEISPPSAPSFIIEHEVRSEGHSNCLWLSFDRRCATVEGQNLREAV